MPSVYALGIFSAKLFYNCASGRSADLPESHFHGGVPAEISSVKSSPLGGAGAPSGAAERVWSLPKPLPLGEVPPQVTERANQPK